MSSDHSRARLWVANSGAWDYFDFEFCNTRVIDSQPDAIETDRLGQEWITEPPDSADKQQYAKALELTFPSRLIHSLTQVSAGGDPGDIMRLAAWLRKWVREEKATFYLYDLTSGTDDAGDAFTEQYYYVLVHPRPLPPWALGNRTGLGGMERYLTLTFTVKAFESSNRGEGTFEDFDDVPTEPDNLTPRGSS